MKLPVQVTAEHNARSPEIEAQYVKIRDLAGKALQRSMAIRAALENFDYKIELAVAELDAELQVVDNNCK